MNIKFWSRLFGLIFALLITGLLLSGCKKYYTNPTETIYRCCECDNEEPCEPCVEPTPEPSPEPTPLPSPTPTPSPEPTPTPSPTPSPQPTPKPSPTPTPTPTPTPPPPPVQGICHVSNKGRPGGNWNLKVSYKANGQGHVKHLDESKYCPADFRSSAADCTESNAYVQLRKQNYCAGF